MRRPYRAAFELSLQLQLSKQSRTAVSVLGDVWGKVSAGANVVNPSANTSVFAQLDVTFGDDTDGKAGMRVSW
jgi:hypothetical protein